MAELAEGECQEEDRLSGVGALEELLVLSG